MDDPKKKKQDRNFVSLQPHEINYVVQKLHEEFPRRERKTIRKVVNDCKKSIEPSELRTKLMIKARRKLS